MEADPRVAGFGVKLDIEGCGVGLEADLGALEVITALLVGEG